MKPSLQAFLDEPVCLERELMGLRLHQLLADLGWSGVLSPVADAGDPTANVRQLLGGHLAGVLNRGLGSLPRSLLEQLLQQPLLLLQLQELLLCEGGPYWEQLSASLPELAALPFPQHLEPLLSPGTRSKRRPALRAALLAGAVLVLGTGVVGLLELQRRHQIQIADLAGQLARVQQQRDEALQKLAALPLPPDEGPHLALLCRSVAALSDLPPEEQLDSLPADETPHGSVAVASGPPVEVLGLAPDEPQLGADSPRLRALNFLQESVRRDDRLDKELRSHSERYLHSDDPSVRDGAALLMQTLGYR